MKKVKLNYSYYDKELYLAGSEIELAEHIPARAFENISDFSHLEIIYYFDKVENSVKYSSIKLRFFLFQNENFENIIYNLLD